MKVAVISKSDRNGGGASRVAEDLAIWLNEAGHPTDHFIAFSHKRPLPFQKSLYGEGISQSLCKKIHSITNRCGFRELLPAEYWFNLGAVLNNYDIIHFHDLFTAISPFTLALAARRKPTFFTIHDCSAFTGGCLYPMGCEKFSTFCHQCPQLPHNTWRAQIRDRSQQIQAIKRRLASQSSIRYIFPSHWMLQQAQQALTFQLEPSVIPYGLDLDPFVPINKSDAKERLGIAPDRKVVVISASSLQDVRKGIHYACTTLQSVVDLSPLVLTVGHTYDELKSYLQGLEVQEIGYITEAARMAEVYSASDVLMFCSLADNLPLTVLEAMAASTVIVGFSTGGVPEMIHNGYNGLLVEPTDQTALNQTLRQALLSDQLNDMGVQARQDVEINFSKTLFLERHLHLYRNANGCSLETPISLPSLLSPALSTTTKSPPCP